MANLIITIISIALVAVAAIMAAWYGGSSFMSAGATAKANAYISYMRQVQSALQIWALDHGAAWPNPYNNFPASACTAMSNFCSAAEVQSFLTPNYLQNATPPGATAQYGVLYYHGTSGNPLANPVISIRLPPSEESVCYKLESMRQGTAVTTLRASSSGNTFNYRNCGEYGCFSNDNSSWGATASWPYIIYLRARGTPDTNNTDYPGPVCPTS